ncbi:hypothetical protein AYO44_00880 [Planctomycetaceae bacterium SCGC AG-212-F19]|nr:hypothetical protein AYO44_00880 [Planctomycetaceae bacterium SCGC AG-212-F19]
MWRRLPVPPSTPRKLRRARVIAFTALLALSVAALAFAQEQKVTPKTSPAKAGPELTFVGEYVGELTDTEGKAVKYGFQVGAHKADEYYATGYVGGLPGAGADPTKPIKCGRGQAKDGAMLFPNISGIKTLFPKLEGSAVVRDGVITVFNSPKGGGTKIGELQRCVRQSPTLGAKPPANAIVLFDGSTNAFFGRNKKDAQLTEDKHLPVPATSKQSFAKDFTLHLEFLHAHGNSPVVVPGMGPHNLEIKHSFGQLPFTACCGAIYQVRSPDVNACLPPLTWQTYDVDFELARFDAEGNLQKRPVMTARLNGVLVHDRFELPETRPNSQAKGFSPKGGPLQLRDHEGDPLVYRNIWLVEKNP